MRSRLLLIGPHAMPGALAAALERARIAAVRVRSIIESGMASAEASFCASNLHNKAADKTTPLRDRVRRRLRAREGRPLTVPTGYSSRLATSSLDVPSR